MLTSDSAAIPPTAASASERTDQLAEQGQSHRIAEPTMAVCDPDEQPCILLVDDNPTNLRLLTAAIRGNQWTTLVANDGQSALDQIAYRHPHLILLDVMMPGLDGFETCKRLKAMPETRDIPVIFMTALSDTADRIKGLALGAVDYITKPFEPEEVLARVRLHLQLSQLNRTLSQKNSTLEAEMARKVAAEAELQALTETLEERVVQRTAQLSESLAQLQATQLKLIQSEKMAALGQLVAGVSHEISNPMCVISGNLDCIQEYVQGLVELIELQQAEMSVPSPAIARKTHEIELDYILEDLPDLLASMRQGTERILEISTSLGTLSRGDRPTKIAYSLHDCLNSAVLILQHRISANEQRPAVQIVKHYGILPLVKCHPGQLNQVFMNLLTNALDAFDVAAQGRSYESLERQPYTIRLKSQLDEAHNQVVVSIVDNGSGISADVQAQMFEPSYSRLQTLAQPVTGPAAEKDCAVRSPIGKEASLPPKRAGLGLAISKYIVEENHGGYLEHRATASQGTEFVIKLPLEL